MAGPFKMKGFSGFRNSPMKTDDEWLKQIFSTQRRDQEATKKIKKQKESGEVKKYQETKSKGNAGAVRTIPNED